MSFFKSIFNSDKPKDGQPAQPDNSNLLTLISNWYLKPDDESYKKVVFELMEGKAFLLLPSVNNNHENVGWETATADTKLTLTSVAEVEGVKMLSAFTDEQALQDWAGKPGNYTALQSDDVLLLCERNGISRVVINGNSYNMFVLERSRKTVKPYTLTNDTLVRVGTAERELEKRISDKMKAGFKLNPTIDEAYQYDNEVNGETHLVIGIKLSAATDDAKTAAVFIVQDALRGEETEQEVKVFFLEDNEWLQTVKKIPGALFYSRTNQYNLYL